MIRLLRRLASTWGHVEDALLVTLLLAMILLAAAQIIGRNLFDTAFVLGDELLRLMVLWLTLAGAMAASRADRHISIAVLDRLLHDRALQLARALTHAFTASICGLIAWYGAAFVGLSREFGDTLLGTVPAWLLQLIIPLGFGVMCLRHATHALSSLFGDDPPAPR